MIPPAAGRLFYALRRGYILLLVCICVTVARSGFATSFSIRTPTTTDSVIFRSNAKLEFVEGFTTAVAGGFVCNPDSSADNVSGVIQVDLRTLDTGIKLRDEHMRENHLQTDKFPMAYFVLKSLTDAPAIWLPDSNYTCTANGDFYIHGVHRKLAAKIHTRFSRTGDQPTMTVHASFSINLDAFGIPRPRALLLKLAETMNIEVILKGYSGLQSPLPAVPDWPELP